MDENQLAIKKAAERGYREAQEDLDWDYGDRIVYYDAKSHYTDDYLNYFTVDISLDDFYWENRVRIDGDTLSSGIIIPNVDTSIHPGSQMPMIDYIHGDRYELQVQPEWSEYQRDTKVSQFIRGVYDRYIRDAVPMSRPTLGGDKAYNGLHRAVVNGLNNGRTDEYGDYVGHVYDFSTKDTGGKMQYSWRLRVGIDTHFMCVEHDKKTRETCIIDENYDNGDLVRKFNMDKYDINVYSQTPRTQQEVDRLQDNLQNMIEEIIIENSAKQKAAEEALIEDLSDGLEL